MPPMLRRMGCKELGRLLENHDALARSADHRPSRRPRDIPTGPPERYRACSRQWADDDVPRCRDNGRHQVSMPIDCEWFHSSVHKQFLPLRACPAGSTTRQARSAATTIDPLSLFPKRKTTRACASGFLTVDAFLCWPQKRKSPAVSSIWPSSLSLKSAFPLPSASPVISVSPPTNS